MRGTLDKTNRKGLWDFNDMLPFFVPAKSENGHFFLHLIKAIGFVVILMMRQKYDPALQTVSENDPFGGGNITLMRRQQTGSFLVG